MLDLKIDQAQLGLDLIKRQRKVREAAAAAERNTRTAILELATGRKGEIEAEIAKCIVKAPQDGLVVYHVPEQVRGGGAQQAVVAQGEPVREGQKMLRICNIDRFTLAARVHEALIARVRVGQPALAGVDSFPRRVLRGRVRSIATTPAAIDWFASDVKLFGVKIALTDKLSGLKPGMTADVFLEIERRAKVLQVPLESVVRIGRETFCYVKVGKGLQERKVKTGARNERDVEITDGLKEDEQVLRALAPWGDHPPDQRGEGPVSRPAPGFWCGASAYCRPPAEHGSSGTASRTPTSNASALCPTSPPSLPCAASRAKHIFGNGSSLARSSPRRRNTANSPASAWRLDDSSPTRTVRR